jgi:hypothetical protein
MTAELGIRIRDGSANGIGETMQGLVLAVRSFRRYFSQRIGDRLDAAAIFGTAPIQDNTIRSPGDVFTHTTCLLCT